MNTSFTIESQKSCTHVVFEFQKEIARCPTRDAAERVMSGLVTLEIIYEVEKLAERIEGLEKELKKKDAAILEFQSEQKIIRRNLEQIAELLREE